MTNRLPPRTAQEAAERLMNERGYVVIGVVPNDPASMGPGFYVLEFAGHPLHPDFQLSIMEATNRADWDSQYRILGFPEPDKNVHKLGQRFYRARLERIGQ